MTDEQGVPGRDNGLKISSPLGGEIGTITVAHRPVDPVLLDRLRTALDDLKASGAVLPGGLSLAVRSIDGFYYLRDLDSLAGSREPDILSVVNYDPSRRTFLLGGRRGRPDDKVELIWFAFKVFESEGLILIHRQEGAPEKEDERDVEKRIEHFLSMVRIWKKENPIVHGGAKYWRLKNLGELKKVASEEWMISGGQ
ncbi:MAG: hypothetical protein ACMUIE_11055 [Thermoplasmatota archaeon]